MGIESAKTGKLLYHLTKLSNLESILENGLVSRKILLDNKVRFEDVANPDIITKRSKLGLDKFTPFHFHPYSSFDVAVKNSFPDEEFIYICITRDLARFNKFKILPKHPLSMDECILYDYDEGLTRIDWDTLVQKGLTDEYAKHVKMAECLTELVIPAEHFQSIVVKDEETKQFVESLFNKKNIKKNPPYINIQNWF
ncbi:DarT ssDNA thymidine ADP-ribosyltransferase family protein [Paenibacillus timonensis]|uniref:DarT ssDNA thymidine ADP-ribosyltransferase family protein n=1 Tax=Paenibacillus timonensis TaxID=225915 RepID=UPI0022E0E50F|nr:DarT ssDNA thymidine ADP-ribosyltransferase family protein [Paenibacillus timonensis]